MAILGNSLILERKGIVGRVPFIVFKYFQFKRMRRSEVNIPNPYNQLKYVKELNNLIIKSIDVGLGCMLCYSTDGPTIQ